MPALIISQALPVFAIAPILMLWLGYGFASKLAMTTLIVFFPVTASTLAGFRACCILGRHFSNASAAEGTVIFHVRLPLAVPYTLSGVRVAASVAPIGRGWGVGWVIERAGLSDVAR